VKHTLALSCLIPTLLFQLSLASIAAEKQADPTLDQYNVVWNTPSVDSAGSMPLGNGDVALNAWVEKSGDLIFYIGKNDAWSGDLSSPRYGVYGLIKVGRVRVCLSPSPFAETAQNFRQELRLREGTFEVSAGTEGQKSSMSLWVDANRPVVHIESKCASPVRMKVSMESWRTEPTQWLAADTVLQNQKDRIEWYYLNPNQEIPQLLNRTIGAAIMGEGLVSKDLVTLESAAPRAAQHVAVHTLTTQSPTPEHWLAKLDKQVSNVNVIPLATARQEHLAWWEQFWKRSYIFITGGEKARDVTLGYTLQRFINACSSRGEFPIKFNGSLFVVEKKSPSIIKSKDQPDIIIPVTADYRAWGHQYWFQNTRPSYWPMMASGDFDLMQPFFRMYRAMLETNSKQVQEFYGHEGAYFRETAPFWGGLEKITSDSPGGFTVHYYTPILEYSGMALDYFAYTGDKDFAKNILIPMADAGVTFFDKHFKRDERGKLFISPANAVETYWKVNNPTPDVAGLQWVLRGLLELPDDLSAPVVRQNWQRLLAELPPIPMGERDNKKVIASYESPKAGHRNMENPELYTVFPFRIYGLKKPDLEIAKNTFETRRNKWFGCWSQNGIQAALLGDTAIAKAAVIKHLTAKGRMRFPAFWPAGFDYEPDQDNGGNGLNALQTMLIQFDGQRILVLPAWPQEWNVDFKLHAPYQTTVSGSYRQGKIVNLIVEPAERRKDVTVMDGTATE